MDRRNLGATGKRGRVDVEQNNTSTQSFKDPQDEIEVLACVEARCEEKIRINSPELYAKAVAKDVKCITNSRSAIEIVDLYSVGHPQTTKAQIENGEAVPFIHRIELEGPQGEVVRIRALFDDGAMVSVMCSSIFQKIKHRLHNYGQSNKKLRMANGNVINSVAKWTGNVRINGIITESTFEVFDSGGSWGFLLGKPTLQAFAAVHDYATDKIKISGGAQEAQLENQVKDQRMMEQGEGVNLTLDEKQQREEVESTRAKRVQERRRQSRTPMGQWRPTVQRTERGTWRKELKRETLRGSEELPAREVNQNSSAEKEKNVNAPGITEHAVSTNVILEQDEGETEDEILEELREPEPIKGSAALYTRQLDPFNPIRVKEILRQITFGDDLTEEERKELEQLVSRNADNFALTLKEVVPIPGATLNLNVPDDAMFNLRIHQ